MTREDQRLEDLRQGKAQWKRWGPYLSERQWGTVREDYSANGTAWEYFPHDHARSRAYRWGEDGLGGRHPDSHHGLESRKRIRAARSASDHLVPQYLVLAR